MQDAQMGSSSSGSGDTLPTTSATKPTGLPDALHILRPLIHMLAGLARLIQWKTNQALLATAVWTAVWFHHHLTLGLVPLFLLVTLAQQPQHNPKSDDDKNNTKEGLATTTTDLIELAEWVSALSAGLQRQQKRITRRHYTVGSLVYLLWLYILHSARLGQLIWLLGCLCLTWSCPWASMLRQRLLREPVAAAPAATPPSKPEYDRLYCFSVVENQRWWLHKGWSHSLMQHDRPAWSDEYQEPTPSISEFTLPPPVHGHQWTWVDPEWKLETPDDDAGGWRYGDWSNNTLLTRRRRWLRCARLEQHYEPMSVVHTPVPKRSSAISFKSSKSTSRNSVHSDTSISSTLSSSLDSMNSPTKSFGGGGPSYRFSPKPRPTSLLTHRSVSSISTITTVSPSSSPSSYKSHFWLNR